MKEKIRKLDNFKSALSFLTTLPAGKQSDFSAGGMIPFFPVTGILIGFLLILFDYVISFLFLTGIVALLDVIFLVVITGAFHLDGVGDTADGIFSHRSRQKALAIMKDSRTGMMGLVAVVLTLALKFAGIYSMKVSCSPAAVMIYFLIVPAYARAGMIFGIKFLNYGREKGTGHDFFSRQIVLKDFTFFLIPVIVSLFAGPGFVIINSAFCIIVSATLFFYQRKMGCITGDMLGAMTEVTEAVLFVAAGMSVIN